MTRIDTDIHNTVPNARALSPFLSDYWRDQLALTGFAGATDTYYPLGSGVADRPGSHPSGGGPAGSHFSTLRDQALDEPQTDVGILNCLYAVDGIHNPDAALALARDRARCAAMARCMGRRAAAERDMAGNAGKRRALGE